MIPWGRSRDWVIQRCTRRREALSVILPAVRPGASILRSLRKLRAELAAVPPAHLISLIGTTGVFELGEFSRAEADSVVAKAEQLGLRIRRRATTCVSHLPFDRTNSVALLIENPDESERVAREMISAGVPVEDLEDE